MIAPDLATLLVFLTTDAACSPALAQHALRHGAAPVWNALTVDNCPSTNDTVLLLANGASGREAGPDELAEAVAEATRDLASQVVADAEGATTSIVVQVDGAASDADARRVGTAVAGSMLVKTAVFGKDPNPGRILQAIGASGARFRPGAVHATLGRVPVIEAGAIPAGVRPAGLRRCHEGTRGRDPRDGRRRRRAGDRVRLRPRLRVRPHQRGVHDVSTPAATAPPQVRERTRSKARVLLEALPFLEEHAGSVVVVKVGGAAMEERALAETFAQDIALLRHVGVRPVVVHGGGPQVTGDGRAARHRHHGSSAGTA